VYQLARRDFLERDFNRSADWHLVRRRAGQVGIEIHARILVERDHCEVVRLIGHAAVEPPVLDHDVGRDVAAAAHFLPAEVRLGVAELAGLLRRIL
jgi:hypothetical protein